jgi:NTE family protein
LTLRDRWQRLLRRTPVERKGSKPIALALQGGGSHGAFTWGVLDRLLEDGRLPITAISGTSAGALNAAVLTSALAKGDAADARAALTAFWRDVSAAGSIFAPFSAGASPNGYGFEQLPGYQWTTRFFRAFSPYEFNPLNLNPLRDVLRHHVDEAALRRSAVQLFVTATAVRTGRPHVFAGKHLGVDALLASACLPFLFQAVEINGEPYWDGGYTGNPSLFPLIYESHAADIVLVKVNPLVRDSTPKGSVEIMDRVGEITFNASLIAEMRAIAFMSRLARERRIDAAHYRTLRMHMIADDASLAGFNAASKLNADLAFLETLFQLGRQAASQFLHDHFAAVGHHSSLDVESTFLGGPPRDALL